jgi:hypothetical protein
MLRELADESVRTEFEATSLIERPLLASIPAIGSARQIRSHRLRIAGALVGSIVSSIAIGLVISHYTSGLN